MTAIEWTDRTWNPTIGCTEVSPGCDNCYAARAAHRGLTPAHQGLTITHGDGTGPSWAGTVRCLPDRLDEPLRWRHPARVFVGSMSDLCHPDVSDEFLGEIFYTMLRAEQHTFQLLTKRPRRLATFIHRWLGDSWAHWLPNLWIGTSIEADRYTWRADHLRHTPAEIRFLSLEPLLGPLESLNLDGIDWVIVGGESGPRARPMHPGWVRDLRDQCQRAGVAFFFKQWGAWAPLDPHDPSFGTRRDTALRHAGPAAAVGAGPLARLRKVGKHHAGRTLDGTTWDQLPTTNKGTGR